MASRGASSKTDDVHLRHALNALLYQTGSPSTAFMLVLATNRPQDIDSAVLDRMDVTLLIGSPDANERLQLLKLYAEIHVNSVLKQDNRNIFQKFFGLSCKSKYRIDADCFTDVMLQKYSSSLEGFSGREISKMMIAVRYALLMSKNQELTKQLFEDTVSIKVKEHFQKSIFSCVLENK